VNSAGAPGNRGARCVLRGVMGGIAGRSAHLAPTPAPPWTPRPKFVITYGSIVRFCVCRPPVEARMSVDVASSQSALDPVRGLWMAFGWAIAAVIMAITIIALPWARAASASRSIHCSRSAKGRFSRGVFRRRGHRHRPCWGCLAISCGWFSRAGGWLSGHLLTAVVLAVDNRGNPVRLGAPETRRPRAVADR
jgi:uncharacterized membrane protein YccF (DUF307 family)